MYALSLILRGDRLVIADLDLAYHNAPGGTRLPVAQVGPASRSLAAWLTYELAALRTGDPHAELVARAQGGVGREPRLLARLGYVDLEVRVGEPLGERR